MKFIRKIKCPKCFTLVDLFRISIDVYYKKCGKCKYEHTFQHSNIHEYIENNDTIQKKLFTFKDMVK